MPGLYRDEGVVLSTIKLGEADRILTLFTRGNGKVRAVAKGIRKTKSRFGGRLEPFTRTDLLIYRGRTLDTITSADIIRSFGGIRGDYERFTRACAMVELVDKFTPERERASSVYKLLLSGLDAVASGRIDTAVPAFTVKLLSISGYHPQLQVCAGCGTQAGLEAFTASLGGAVCGLCRQDDGDAVDVDLVHLDLMSKLLASDFGHRADAAIITETSDALRSYAEYFLERPVRSLRFLAEAAETGASRRSRALSPKS
jgi:DNA repair protein RecO (recombination protein O)